MAETDRTYSTAPELSEPAAFPARLEALIGNMSVRAFARKAGVSDTFLRQCLAGRTEPTRTKLLAIAEAGEATVEWLATGGSTRDRHTAVAVAEAERTPIDRELLESVIERTEEILQQSSQPLSPARKARLIGALYDMHADSSPESISHETIHKLIASAV